MFERLFGNSGTATASAVSLELALAAEFVTSANILPEHRTVRHLALVTAAVLQPITLRQNENAAIGYNSCLQALCSDAVSLGANAVLNVHLTTGTVQKQGSAWMTHALYLTGDAVIVERQGTDNA